MQYVLLFVVSLIKKALCIHDSLTFLIYFNYFFGASIRSAKSLNTPSVPFFVQGVLRFVLFYSDNSLRRTKFSRRRIHILFKLFNCFLQRLNIFFNRVIFSLFKVTKGEVSALLPVFSVTSSAFCCFFPFPFRALLFVFLPPQLVSQLHNHYNRLHTGAMCDFFKAKHTAHTTIQNVSIM